MSDGEDETTRSVTVNVFGPDQGGDRFRVLVFSKTTGFRHDSIDEGIAAIEQLGEDNDFQVDASEDATLFRDNVLSHYDAVVFLSTTGDPLNDTQQEAFERYIRGGGGYVGVHSATDTEYDWPWYGQLVGAYFKRHPQIQDARVDVRDLQARGVRRIASQRITHGPRRGMRTRRRQRAAPGREADQREIGCRRQLIQHRAAVQLRHFKRMVVIGKA